MFWSLLPFYNLDASYIVGRCNNFQFLQLKHVKHRHDSVNKTVLTTFIVVQFGSVLKKNKTGKLFR